VTKPTDYVWFLTRTLAPRQYLVEYRTRIKRIDRIEVTIPESLEDDPAVAELAAMHQVLVVKGALGETRGGNGVRMVVSRGAVRKAARRMTSKGYLVPLARFLSTRFAQAEIEVDHEGRWAEPGICRSAAEKLVASETLGDSVNLPGLGPAEISHHVVGQIARRYQVDSDLGAWRLLTQACAQRRFREIIVSAEERARMQERHGLMARLFHDGQTRMQLVVVPAEAATTGRNTVVTAYFMPYSSQ
jgi:hypothetical protein